MKKLNTIILILLGMICTQLYAVQLNSIYPLKPNDSEAFYFTPENYPIKADGKMDVSDALQAAINQVKKEKNFESFLSLKVNIKSARPFIFLRLFV